MKVIREWIEGLGHFSIFTFDSILWAFRPPRRVNIFLSEMEFIGNDSLFIVGLSSIFSGAVFAYQSWLGFKLVGTESLVGAAVSVALVRELAPVLTGLVVAGRAGAAMAARIGSMRVTEQIDAMEVMAVVPKQYLVAPRIWAATCSVPLLVALFGLIGNLGGYLVGVYVCGIDSGMYIQKLKEFLMPWDFYHGLLKGAFFGFLLAAIGCYKGYHTEKGAEGVGRATNDAVVFSMVSIIVLDYFLSILLPNVDVHNI